MFFRDLGSGIRDPATRHQVLEMTFFLNMWSRDEDILPTKSKRTFETMTILPMAKAFAVIVQKQPEAGLLLVKIK